MTPRLIEDNPEALDALVWTPRFLAAMDRLLTLEETHGRSVQLVAGNAGGVHGVRPALRAGSGTSGDPVPA
jgi:hypothetical protein